jgi:hypothetical protein
MMRSIRHISFAAAGSVFLIGSTAAAELTNAEVKDLIVGKTLYIETTPESTTGTAGKSILYYAPDGTVLFKTPKGVMWHGTWQIKDNTACVDWKESPNNPCTKYDKQGDTISNINSATGKVRGKIVKTAAGNAENLAP